MARLADRAQWAQCPAPVQAQHRVWAAHRVVAAVGRSEVRVWAAHRLLPPARREVLLVAATAIGAE
jgi:hypothetical protein